MTSSPNPFLQASSPVEGSSILGLAKACVAALTAVSNPFLSEADYSYECLPECPPVLFTRGIVREGLFKDLIKFNTSKFSLTKCDNMAVVGALRTLSAINFNRLRLATQCQEHDVSLSVLFLAASGTGKTAMMTDSIDLVCKALADKTKGFGRFDTIETVNSFDALQPHDLRRFLLVFDPDEACDRTIKLHDPRVRKAIDKEIGQVSQQSLIDRIASLDAICEDLKYAPFTLQDDQAVYMCDVLGKYAKDSLNPVGNAKTLFRRVPEKVLEVAFLIELSHLNEGAHTPLHISSDTMSEALAIVLGEFTRFSTAFELFNKK